MEQETSFERQRRQDFETADEQAIWESMTDEGLIAPEGGTRWPARARPATRLASTTRLPALTELIGRERELAMTKQLLESPAIRLLTLTGPGGVGKTRLALQLAEAVRAAYPDGVIWAALAPLRDADLVIPTIARAAGLGEIAGRDPRDALRAFLQDRRALLVLDNFEHVLDASPEIADLLIACRGLDVLATSRAPLNVQGEQEYVVPPLELPATRSGENAGASASEAASVRLFIRRAQAVSPAFALNSSNAAAVADICRRLDGLPLALELAAARTKILSPQALRARLSQQLGLLTGGPRDAPPRLQTMRAAIAWSCDLLASDEQRSFRRLAVFAGGFTLEAAEAIHDAPNAGDSCGAELSEGPVAAALDAIASLVEKSLIQQTVTPEGESRFSMLSTIRDFGLEQLESAGESAAIRQRHAVWFRDLAEIAERDWFGPNHALWQDRLELEIDNLRAAFEWSIQAGGRATLWRLTNALWFFWFGWGAPSEGRGWFARLLASGEAPSAGLRVRALIGAGLLAMAQGDFDAASGFLEPGWAEAVQIGDRASVGRALFGLGVVAQDEGDPKLAETRFQSALAEFEAASDDQWIATTLNNLGLVIARQGNTSHGEALLRRALSMHEAMGYEPGAALGRRFLGQVAQLRGDDEAATRLFLDSLLPDWRRSQGWHVANSLEGLAGIAVRRRRPELAARLLAAATVIRDQIGVPVEPALRPGHEALIASARAAITSEAFNEAWLSGQEHGVEAAIDSARELLAAPETVTAHPAAQKDRLPGGLSEREAEVLRLIATGLTNAQTAERLFISPRTVDAHLQRIYDKLGVARRAEAIRFALEEGVV